METVSRVTTSPLRVMARWMLVPFQLAVAIGTGVALGWFSGWVSAGTLDRTSFLYLLGVSPALWVACIAALGATTRSWTFAVVFGMACALTARGVDHLAARFYLDTMVTDRSTLVAEVPFAVVAGAMFGWAGSVWRHDEGLIRATGTSLVAGVLVWDGWNFVQSDSLNGQPADLYGWALIGSAVLVVAFTRQPGTIAVATLGTLAIAWGLDRAFDSHVEFVRPLARDLLDYLRDMVRNIQDILR